MDEAPATQYSLIAKLRDPADAQAWQEFLAIYEPLVYRLARAKGLQDADAQDVCQDVFRAVARSVDRWEPDVARGTFRGWLFTIARNLTINFLTRRDRHPRGSGDSDVQMMLHELPATDGGATAEFDAAYQQRLFRWAADERLSLGDRRNALPSRSARPRTESPAPAPDPVTKEFPCAVS